VFSDPGEAVFVMLGEDRDLEPHADLREELLRRTLQAAMEDPRPGCTDFDNPKEGNPKVMFALDCM
jgi:hypothetical protein